MSVRKADINDGREFNALVNTLGGASLFRAQFGQYNFTSLIEYAHMSLLLPAEDGSCGGFATFCDGQLNLSDGATFDEIIASLSELVPCRSTNSLLLNFWALNSNTVGDNSGFDLLRYLFNACPAVNYVFWLCSETVSPPDFIADHFNKMNLSKRTVEPDKDPLLKQSVYYIHRSKVLPQLQVREARVEDNDDLLPILQSSNPNIANGQEEYFLANLIQSQDDRSKFFVGVHKNRPVGMLATSLDINAELLSRVFELEPYTGLVTIPESTTENRLHVSLLVGEPEAIKKLNLGRLCEQTRTVWIDGDELKHADESIRNSGDFVDAIRAQVDSISTTPGGPRGCVITGLPRTEAQSRSLLSKMADANMVIDAVLELQRVEDIPADDVDDADDAVGDLLDAIEMIRDAFTSAEGYTDDVAYSFEDVSWRKILVESEGEDVDDLTLVELKSILDSHDEKEEAIRLANQEGPNTNAFAISLFSMDEKFESRSEDLLRVAFEEYTEYDYCILMVPNATIPSAALTQGMQCPRVKEGVSFDQSLYLIHRHALLAHDHLSVVRLVESHLTLVDGVLDSLDSDVIEDVSSCVKRSLRDKDVELSNNPAEVSFAVTLGDDLVGVVCVSRKVTTSEDITLFRENYQLDDLVSFERHRGRAQAMITHWVVNPVFSKWARFILREVMRHYRKTLLYFVASKSVKPCRDMAEEMDPVRIRNKAYALPDTVNPASGEVESVGDVCDKPLFIMLKKNLSIPKTSVSKRIVIVGGNMSAFAVIEKICMSRDMYAHNIFLVMDSPPTPWKKPEELPVVTNDDEEEKRPEDNYSGLLSPTDTNGFTEQELNALGLAHRVTLVQGKLSDIDRKNRAIIVSDEVIVEYDVLVIASSLQDASYKKFPSLKSVHPSAFPEKGIFCLGNYAIDELAVAHFKKEETAPSNSSSSTRIVVYGDGVKALATLGKLEEMGVDPTRLTWITREEELTEFEIDDMLKIVETGIGGNTEENEEEEGKGDESPPAAPRITVYRNTQILDVVLPSAEEESGSSMCLEGINLLWKPPKNSVMGPKEEFVECSTLICCSNLQCDLDIFTAINECGLVFDGGVVVNENFRTSDSHIYACGDFTRYSRRYRGEIDHSRINAKELGEYVANEIIKKHLTLEAPSDMDGSASVISDPYGPDIIRFPKFRSPKIMDCRFPGCVHYFTSQLPDATPANTGKYMVTGPTDDLGKRVCGLKIAKLGYVAELTCIQNITEETTPYERHLATYVGCLVGWHDCYLNSPSFAYDSNAVKDWVEFFSEDWVSALRFDRFPFVADIVRNSLFSDKGMINILDKVMENAESTDDVDMISIARKNIVGDRGAFIDSKTRAVVSAYVIDFVRKNKGYLSNYYIPEPKSNKLRK